MGNAFGGGGGGGGGGGYTHTIIQREYHPDPVLTQQVQANAVQIQQTTAQVVQLQTQIQATYQQTQQQRDPNFYNQLKTTAFKEFLTNIPTLKFTEKIPKVNGEKHHILIGKISSGKSSLINYSCKTNLPVGVGECTQQIRKVAASKDGKIHIWDSPGVNEDFSFYDPQVLAYFHSADRIFILFPESLKSCKQMIQVLYKIKPQNTFLIRTQCDRWDSTQAKTIEQQLQTDRQLLSSWRIHLPVFATSAQRPQNFLDNAKFINLLTGKQ